MAGCIFCKIAAGEILATVVKRGDGLLATVAGISPAAILQKMQPAINRSRTPA